MASQPKLVRQLSLLDSVLLLAGGIIGSGIFLTAQDVATSTRTPLLFILVWVIGMVITMLACFAFAEMGAMFPDAGGQYIYMREAYGEFVGFLYGWMIFTVSIGGTNAALAAGFSQYLGKVFPALAADQGVLAIGHFVLTRGHLVALAAITLQTVINMFGVHQGAILQNIATWLKFGAIGAFVVLGLAIGHGSWGHYRSSLPGTSGTGAMLSGIGVALIAVFFAYDGWVYISWVAGEVKDPQRTLPRALIGGMLLVGVIYVAINAVYLYALPMSGIAETSTVAQAAAVQMFHPAVGRWLALLIAVSCFGAMASCILSGARVYYAMAEDGIFFKALARVHPRWHTPVWSLVLQGIWAGALALSGTYSDLISYVIFMMVLSYVLSVAALFILRRKMPDAPRPYRCPGYPWLPGLYLVLGGAWAINALFEKPKDALFGIIIVLVGVPFYFYWRRQKRQEQVSIVPSAP
ncbi:MAG TPA: amino acid permease [Candidatus Angelobacter sp.]|nr:amino acid permease [Candidatus Angelobacter sp.]